MFLSTIATVLMMYSLVHEPNDPVPLALLLFLTGLLLSLGLSALGIYPSCLRSRKLFPVGTALGRGVI